MEHKEDLIKKVIEAMGKCTTIEKNYLRGYFKMDVSEWELDTRIVAYLQNYIKEHPEESVNLHLEGN